MSCIRFEGLQTLYRSSRFFVCTNGPGPGVGNAPDFISAWKCWIKTRIV